MILCVEFQQVHYIDLSEIVQFVKADTIVISVNLKLSSEPFLLSVTFWVLNVPRMEFKLRFWDPEKVYLSSEQRDPFNRGI